MAMSEWYYSHDGQQKGPVPVSELARLASSGEFDPEKDLVWREGMPDWQPAASVSELSFGKPAPETATAEPAAPSAGGFNPYSAPTTYEATAPHSAVGDLPPVKRANFAICATLLIIGVLGFVASYIPMILEIMKDPENPNFSQDTTMVMGGGFLVSFALMMAGQIFSLVYLYRAWFLLQPHTSFATPGKAVGFLFIPFYNLYWVFVAYWRWSQEWNRIIVSSPKHSQAPRMTEGLFLTYPILSIAGGFLGIIGMIPLMIVQLIVIKSVCNAVNYAAQD